MKAVLVFAFSLLVACAPQPGLWQWQHTNAEYARRYRERDIDQCEQHALEARMNGDKNKPFLARDYGGWGDFPFEFCMQERGWRQEFGPVQTSQPGTPLSSGGGESVTRAKGPG